MKANPPLFSYAPPEKIRPRVTRKLKPGKPGNSAKERFPKHVFPVWANTRHIFRHVSGEVQSGGFGERETLYTFF
ncbi:hypothetical protein [Methanocalculus natronophilus]|uniref:hypothetical protein n=1 Tax=Methanocalculus natronophilus TaxID=1262400 RepID=UPI0031B5CCA2|nr:hypothetical protein [Methanocalculus sp. AMF5]